MKIENAVLHAFSTLLTLELKKEREGKLTNDETYSDLLLVFAPLMPAIHELSKHDKTLYKWVEALGDGSNVDDLDKCPCLGHKNEQKEDTNV